jgi:hypothetical protein
VGGRDGKHREAQEGQEVTGRDRKGETMKAKRYLDRPEPDFIAKSPTAKILVDDEMRPENIDKKNKTIRCPILSCAEWFTADGLCWHLVEDHGWSRSYGEK